MLEAERSAIQDKVDLGFHKYYSKLSNERKLEFIWGVIVSLSTSNAEIKAKVKKYVMHPRWRLRKFFIADLLPGYKEGYTLDKVDVDKPYAPGNIIWVKEEEAKHSLLSEYHTLEFEKELYKPLYDNGKVKANISLFKCFCGNSKDINLYSVNNGAIVSCGCIKDLHGMNKHTLYSSWYDMLRRCYDDSRKDYMHYGGRGIEVCEEWWDFFTYTRDLKDTKIKGISLDRIDGNGNYCLDNTRLANQNTQTRNLSGKKSNNTTGFNGSSPITKDRIKGNITINGVPLYLGVFKTGKMAGAAHDIYALHHNYEHLVNGDISKAAVDKYKPMITLAPNKVYSAEVVYDKHREDLGIFKTYQLAFNAYIKFVISKEFSIKLTLHSLRDKTIDDIRYATIGYYEDGGLDKLLKFTWRVIKSRSLSPYVIETDNSLDIVGPIVLEKTFISEFKASYRPGTKLVRVDSTKPYSLSNIIWVDKGEVRFEELLDAYTPPVYKTKVTEKVAAGKKKHNKAVYKCLCGNTFVTRDADVKAGKVKACGCLSNLHNVSSIKLHGSWEHMLAKTFKKVNDAFINKEDAISERWYNIHLFVEDMLPTHEEGMRLVRIDESKPYCKDNCKWVTKADANRISNKKRYSKSNKKETL